MKIMEAGREASQFHGIEGSASERRPITVGESDLSRMGKA